MAKVHLGDCLEILRGMADASVDAIVTDPPYGLSFMGKKWDYNVPSADIWRECLRVLKPGGHLLAFAGTRTQHRMAVNIEDAGFEIRDMIAWVYGSGFPKSLDVSKAIDRAAGAEREIVGPNKFAALNGKSNVNCYGEASRPDETAPATSAARQWQGWGTALKPALEPITVARKPLVGTVAENVLTYGTGALNIDGCRVEATAPDKATMDAKASRNPTGKTAANVPFVPGICTPSHDQGRWPANLIHDGSDQVTQLAGSAARFFYCAKASKADRDDGLEGFEEREVALPGKSEGYNPQTGEWSGNSDFRKRRNHHPTVKPTALMRYLCRLVTPPKGIVLDPFMGSGSTGKAAMLEGFQFIGIEREAEYVEIANARIAKAEAERGEMLALKA